MRNLPITCRAFRPLACLSFAVTIAPVAHASPGLPTALPEWEEPRKVGGGQMTWLDPRSVARDQHAQRLSDADTTAAPAKNAPD